MTTLSTTKTATVSNALHSAAFVLILLNVTLSPVFFGAKEMWWFWGMASLIFGACLCSGAALLIELFANPSGVSRSPDYFVPGKRFAILLGSALPFLVYALIRSAYPSAPDRPMVAQEAEYNLLLFFTPVAIATVMFFSFTRRRLRILMWAVLVMTALVGAYGMIVYAVADSAYVAWVRTNLYGIRLKGTFYCPNHTSAYLNFGVLFFTALLFAPGVRRGLRIAGAVVAVLLLVPNFLTLSRGGIFSLLAAFIVCAPTIALRGYKAKVRVLLPVVIVLAGVGLAAAILKTDNPMMARIKGHSFYRNFEKVVNEPDAAVRKKVIHDTFWYGFDRGWYIGATLRGWRSNPTWGIGPGQHPNRWPEFAATEDGTRDPLKPPRLRNDGYHLYESHSDWTQLLEEYGTVGFVLFLLPALTVLVMLLRSQSAVTAVPQCSDIERALPLAALLLCAVMTVHSLGDFSFQVPAIVWTFAAVITGGLLVPQKTVKDNS